MPTFLVAVQIIGALSAAPAMAWDYSGDGDYFGHYVVPRNLVPMRVVVPSDTYRPPTEYDFRFMPAAGLQPQQPYEARGPGDVDRTNTTRPPVVVRRHTNWTAPPRPNVKSQQGESTVYEPPQTTTEFTYTEATLPPAPEDTSVAPTEAELDTSTPAGNVEPSTAETDEFRMDMSTAEVVGELGADTAAQAETTQKPIEATDTEETEPALRETAVEVETASTEAAQVTAQTEVETVATAEPQPEPAGATTQEYPDYTGMYGPEEYVTGTGDYGTVDYGPGYEYDDNGEEPELPELPEDEEEPEEEDYNYTL